MRNGKNFDVANLDNAVGGIYELDAGGLMCQFRYSPAATFLENAELAKDITEAYEKYVHSITTRYGVNANHCSRRGM